MKQILDSYYGCDLPLEPIIPPCRARENQRDIKPRLILTLPKVNPRAGDTNLVPKTEKAPDTGYIADISPLYTSYEIRVSHPKDTEMTGTFTMI